MRNLLGFESKKSLLSKGLLTLAILFFLLNALFMQQIRPFELDTAAWRKADNYLQGLNSEEQVKFITEHTETLSIYFRSGFEPEPISEIDLDSEAVSKKPSLLFSDDQYTEMYIMDELQKQLDYIKQYPSFIEQTRDANKSTISIFKTDDPYQDKVDLIMAETYQPFTDFTLPFTNHLPFEAFDSWYLGDIFVLVLIVILTYSLILREQEEGVLALLTVQKNGRKHLVLSKIFILLFAAFGFNLIFALEKLIVYSLMYGEINLAAPIQTQPSYQAAVLQISTGGYLVLEFLLKSCAYFIVALIFLYISQKSKNATGFFLSIAFLLGIEFAIRYLISQESFLAILRYVNIVILLKPSSILHFEFLVNIFGQPVSARLIYFITSLSFLVFFFLANYFYFTSRDIIFKRNNVEKATSKKQNFSASLFIQENYKLLIMHKAVFVLIVLLCCQLYINLQPFEFQGLDAKYYEQYMLSFSGEVTSEKVEAIAKERMRFDQLHQELAEIEQQLEDKQITSFEAKQMEKSIHNQLMPEYAFQRVEERLAYLQMRESQGYKVAFIYDAGIERIAGLDYLGGRAERLSTLLLISGLLLFFTNYYTYDEKLGIRRLTSVYPYGKTKQHRLQIRLGLGYGIIIFALAYLPQLARTLIQFGWHGVGDTLSSLPQWQAYPQDMPLLFYFIMLFINRALLAYILVLIIHTLAYKYKSTLTTIIIFLVLLIIPLGLSYSEFTAIDNFSLNKLLLGNPLYLTKPIFMLLIPIVSVLIINLLRIKLERLNEYAI